MEARAARLKERRDDLLRGLRGTCTHERVVEFQLLRTTPGGKDYSARYRFCLACGDQERAGKHGILGVGEAHYTYQRLTATPIAQLPEDQLERFVVRLHNEGRFHEFDTEFPTAP